MDNIAHSVTNSMTRSQHKETNTLYPGSVSRYAFHTNLSRNMSPSSIAYSKLRTSSDGLHDSSSSSDVSSCSSQR